MKTYLFLLTLCSSLQLLAQNHLEPVEKRINYQVDTTYIDSVQAKNLQGLNDILKLYDQGVDKILHRGFSDQDQIRYSVRPSFTAEYAMTMHSYDDGTYLVVNKCSSNYWYTGNGGQEIPEKDSVLILDKHREAIDRIFGLAIEQIKVPVQDMLGRDGTTYYFSYLVDGKHVTGTVWSPAKGSLTRNLVDCCEKLVSLASGKDVSEKRLDRILTEMVNELEKNH